MSTETLRVQIEQRIARGWTNDRIAGELCCSIDAVGKARTAMDTLIDSGDPVDDEILEPLPVPPVLEPAELTEVERLIRRAEVVRDELSAVLSANRAVRPCGTHAAFIRHKNRGEQPCDACILGERRYQQARYRRRPRARGVA